MNLRILKKLSKRAAPLLRLIGDGREQFRADGDQSGYMGVNVRARKHWERCRSTHGDLMGWHQIKTPAANGNGWISMSPPSMARKGTIMVGGMTGYYEPEWSELTAWEALVEQVGYHFDDYDHERAELVPTRRLKTPSEVFAAASEMIENMRAGAGA